MTSFVVNASTNNLPLADNYFDAVVTDPPYGISFMGKKWDYNLPSVDLWQEVYRVMKPGAHMLAFGGPRTYHRAVCRIEDAGFEIRDCLMWLFGSGFPKSLDVSKALDKTARRDYVEAAVNLGLYVPDNSYWDWTKGEHSPSDKWWARFKERLTPEQWQAVEREVIGHIDRPAGWFTSGDGHDVTAPATDLAKQWAGWGTALKPAFEPIVLARKPLEGTVAENVARWGCGALNIDGCRIGTESTIRPDNSQPFSKGGIRDDNGRPALNRSASGSECGRWPANIVHDGSNEVLAFFPNAPGQIAKVDGSEPSTKTEEIYGKFTGDRSPAIPRVEVDRSAARFFYCAKASKAEREAGLNHLPERIKVFNGQNSESSSDMKPVEERFTTKARNHHPTVKPVALLRYLCRLITPPDGLILDPFYGSGSTGVAAEREGFRCVGIDEVAGYTEIARLRNEHEANRFPLFKEVA